MSPRPVCDASPLSEFIAKMREVFQRRLAALDATSKADIEREMTALMREYLGRRAWDALDAAEGETVPRDTTRDRRRHGHNAPSRYRGSSVDRKLAGAGPDE